MRYLFLVATVCAIGSSMKAWDGSLNSAVVGWAVAAMMFIVSFLGELEKPT